MDVDTIGKTVQVLSVVIGVVISVLSFNNTRNKEAEARRIEASKPFLAVERIVFTAEGLPTYEQNGSAFRGSSDAALQ